MVQNSIWQFQTVQIMTTAHFTAIIISIIAAFLWIVYFASKPTSATTKDRSSYESYMDGSRDAKLTLPFAIGLTLVAAICWTIAFF